MLSTPLLLVALAPLLFAQQNDREASFLELIKVGQYVQYSVSDGRYSLTIFSKQRKLQVLAAYKLWSDLTVNKEQLAGNVPRAEIELKRSLASQICRQPMRVGRPPQFHRVDKVGKDFISIDISDNRVRTVALPVRTIEVVYFEEVDERELPDIPLAKNLPGPPGNASAGNVRRSSANVRTNKGFADQETVHWGGHRYLLVSETMTPNEARRYCESLGGHLARFESEEEYLFAAKLLGGASIEQQHPYCWVDGSDERVEGEWVYSNGKPLAYCKWTANSPDDFPNEHSLCIDFRDMLFSDANTSWRCVFLCEWDGERQRK